MRSMVEAQALENIERRWSAVDRQRGSSTVRIHTINRVSSRIDQLEERCARRSGLSIALRCDWMVRQRKSFRAQNSWWDKSSGQRILLSFGNRQVPRDE
jgi:hypothetical protein